MAGEVPEDRFPELIAWMYPLLGDDDRENMTRIWQMVMPPQAFGGAMQLVHQAIGDDFAELNAASPTWPHEARIGAGRRGDGKGRPPGGPEPLIRVGDDFEVEYPGASALATECYANLWRAGDLLMELHNQQTRDQYGLSPSARQVLAVVEGAGHRWSRR